MPAAARRNNDVQKYLTDMRYGLAAVSVEQVRDTACCNTRFENKYDACDLQSDQDVAGSLWNEMAPR